jgi:hypothetical protein
MTKSTKVKAAAESPKSETQSDKFKEAARELGCDEDEARWDERLRKVAQQKVPDKPE